MESIEFIIALAGFISAFVLIVASMNLLLFEMNQFLEKISLESKAQKCALIVNAVYAHNSEKVNEKIECIVLNGKSITSNENNSLHSIVLNKSIKTIVKNGKTIILVNGNEHYK